MQLCCSLSILWHCLSLGLEWKLTFSSPVATDEFLRTKLLLTIILVLCHRSIGVIHFAESKLCLLSLICLHFSLPGPRNDHSNLSFYAATAAAKSLQLCLTAAHQAPPSLGFSRQEHWSVLQFPSPMHEGEKWKWSRSVVSDSSRPHGLQLTRLIPPRDFPGAYWSGLPLQVLWLYCFRVFI